MKSIKVRPTAPAKSPRHSTPRDIRGRDRRAEARAERDNVLIVLLPCVFSQKLEGAA